MRIFTLLSLCLFLSSNVSAQSTWEIVAKDIDPNNYYGITVANGMLGMVSSAEPLKVKDVVLNGAYDYYQRGRVSNILKVFNPVNMNLDIDNQRINKDNIQNYQQSLNMQTATLSTTFDAGSKASIQTELLALRHLPYTSMLVVTIKAKQNLQITPASIIEAPIHMQDVRNYYAEIDRPHVKIPLMTSVGLSPSGSLKIAASNSFIFEEPHGSEPHLIHEDWDYNMHLAKFYKELKAGETYTFTIVSSIVASNEYDDPHNEAERLTLFAALEGKNRLLQRHQAAWAQLWTSDIQIEGDDESQRDVRSALYHLYSFVRAGTGLSLSPMGLSGLGYNGHVFWDTELWMYPPLLIMHPEIAESILDYRYNRLEAAKQNAFSHGFAGAMFPWESAFDGSEDTPVWAITGPFEHHITGCIGWAIWKYYQVTGDKVWLENRGYPMLKEIADFWASRVDRDGPNNYNIRNVVAANEWEENIDNDAFTNGVAILSLRYATQAATELGLSPNIDWNHVADNIKIEKFADGVTRENSTFEKRMIKQADVNLLAFPLDLIRDKGQIEKDLKYYEPLMSPDGPAMGFSVLAALYARLGKHESIYTKFKQSYKANELPPFGVIAEVAGGTNPYFATGAGGMLQAVLMGIGGLEITDDGIVQLEHTALPKEWTSFKIIGVGKDKQTFTIK